MSNNVTTKYIPSAKKPIRYEHLRPGSFFRIVSEPSRKLFKVDDMRIYQRDYVGFFSQHPVTGEACILYPQDLVMPMRRVREDARPVRK